MGEIYYTAYYDTGSYKLDGEKRIVPALSASVVGQESGLYTLTLVLPNSAESRAMADPTAGYFRCDVTPQRTEYAFFPVKRKITRQSIEIVCKQNISRMNEVFLMDDEPITSVADLKQQIKDAVQRKFNTQYKYNFNTDYTGAYTAAGKKRYTIVQAIQDFKQVVGGSLSFEQTSITHKTNPDIEAEFLYGQNLIAETYELDYTNYARTICVLYSPPEGVSGDKRCYYFTIPGREVSADFPGLTEQTAPIPQYAIVLDDYEITPASPGKPTKAELQAVADAWIEEHKAELSEPQLYMKIRPLLFSQTTEGWADGQKLYLGAKVRIKDDETGVDTTAYVTGLKYDPIREVFTDMELSSSPRKLPRLINKIAKNSGTKIYT